MSGIFTDGKQTVFVQNHTQLTGGALISKTNDRILDTGTLGFKDIKNKDEYQTASVAYSINNQAGADNKAATDKTAATGNKTEAVSSNPLAVNSGSKEAALNEKGSATGGYYQHSKASLNWANMHASKLRRATKIGKTAAIKKSRRMLH